MQDLQFDSSVTSPLLEDVTSETVGPGPSTLEGQAFDTGCSRGVALEPLPAGTVLTVHTRHSCYRVEVLDGVEGRVLITGGSVFPERTEVRVAGATTGGNNLKVGWIGEGLRLDLLTIRGRVVTSCVESITVGDESTNPD